MKDSTPTRVSVKAVDDPLDRVAQRVDNEGRLSVVSPLLQLDAKVTAKFKIEYMFGSGRTTAGPNTGTLQVWESGKKLHGGGDEKAYWCLEKDRLNTKNERTEGTHGCGNIIIGNFIGSATVRGRHGQGVASQLMAQCPHCGGVIPADMLTGEKLDNVTTDRLAEILAEEWHRLKGEADIYLKFAPDDIRYQMIARIHGNSVARRIRGLTIYPLANILKETAAGSSLVGRFKAFLRA